MDFSQIDEVTGNFPGWNYIPLILGGINLIVAVGLFLLFKNRYRTKRYSYVNVMILGLCSFIFVLSIYLIQYFFNIRETDTFYLMLVHFIFSARTFVLSTFPIVTILVLIMIISNIKLLIKEELCLNNMFGLMLSAVIIVALILSYFTEYHGTLMLPNAVKNMWYFGYCYLASQFISVVVVAVMLGKHKPEYDKDYIIILGCMIRPDGSLYPLIRGRVDNAMKFITEQEETADKKAAYMPSGGKGTDEKLSEGEAMKRYLLQQGVPEERIIAETESKTTYENLKNSREIIGDETKKVAFSTTNYHVMRAGMIADTIGWDIDGMGCATSFYYWPNAMAREFVGLLARTWKLQLFVGLVLMGIASGLTLFIELF